MRRNKLTNNSKFKSKWISIKLIWGLIVLFSAFNLGCDKEEEADVYYVKYVINASNINPGGKLNVTINNENSEKVLFVIDQNSNWESIIGPVSKGFSAALLTSNETGTERLNVYSEIDVSKNNSPFAIKASDESYVGEITLTITSTVLNYTIDY